MCFPNAMNKFFYFLLFFEAASQITVAQNTIRNIDISKSIPVVTPKCNHIFDILEDVVCNDIGKSYYSDTLYYGIAYVDTILTHDVSINHDTSAIIKAGTSLYLFCISPYPEGFLSIDDSIFYVMKFGKHLCCLNNYGERRVDKILFSSSCDSISRNKIRLEEPMEDDRWPTYWYYLTTNTAGKFIWKRYACLGRK